MNRKVHLLDIHKSALFPNEIAKFKEEITKQKNNTVCMDLSTMGIAKKGAIAMQTDGFYLLEEQLDV